ncbi:hypothetical protein Dfri01_46860 [Dyadobacter frigoris]|uniref:sigma 54-interacting response regulator n=1 Tax=Dyadobacter frigoris TaxID=2576211 RepID=UPI0024A0DE25|nr:sigma 54-interacting response regulator [Dyadobacter frigoris]GLU55225.1 hypothetical protein Dfri01_46860 [Dyadobacter frigoris]
MSLKILIVEDQFIEANDLSIILEKAGHEICGIAKSVSQALQILDKQTPEIVLLDIFLKGIRTGIDLAKILAVDGIPFIYLSANSNIQTLEAAKETQPYGFLVKPFRERDLLIALDIAAYRHKNNLDRADRQVNRLGRLLMDFIARPGDYDQKTMMLVKIFKVIIPFDYLFIYVHDAGKATIQGFQRISFDDYASLSNLMLHDQLNLAEGDLKVYSTVAGQSAISFFHNGLDFINYCTESEFSSALRGHYKVKSNLVYEVNSKVTLSFYSIDSQSYIPDHIDILTLNKNLLLTVIENINSLKNSDDLIFTEKELQVFADPLPNPKFADIIGNSPKLLHALDQATNVAPFDTSVLIMGETGVGKEGIVGAIHKLSSRNLRPIIKVNCAAIPASLIESELFGHEKGAFTGAIDKRIGKFEQANGGTIFLDEIGEIPLEIQSKLLRVIQEKELERIGGRTTIKVDVRIIAATNRNLYKEVAAGNFRIDLYYRLNVFPITLPPLRERYEDIPLLIDYFLKKHAGTSGGVPKTISLQMLSKLCDYSWPGNVRELQHFIERLILITATNHISVIDLPGAEVTVDQETTEVHKFKTMADLDREHIFTALKKCNGRVSGKGGAAALLNLPPTTLASKMKKLGIVWEYTAE